MTTQHEYFQRWYAKLKADPERYEEFLRKQREWTKKQLARVKKAAPERYAARQQYVREWHEAHREQVAEYQREYREANRETLLSAKSEYTKKVRATNPERLKAIQRKYRQTHREKIAEYGRKIRAANPGKKNEYTRKRRAIKLNAPGSHTETEWQALKAYYKDQCLCCGDVPDHLQQDHVVPLSKGGSDDISNIQPLCPSCNMRKNAKTIDYR